VDAGGKVQQRLLTLDRAIGDQWLVTSGLAAGDRVIVEGMQKVRPALPVKEVPFDAGQAEQRKPAAGPARNRNRSEGGARCYRNSFLDRPVFAWVIAIIMMVAGGWRSTTCPSPSIRPSPRRPSPSRAFYPGASAETVENSVTQIIEQKMTGFDKMLYCPPPAIRPAPPASS
jgi:hypothetical protein